MAGDCKGVCVQLTGFVGELDGCERVKDASKVFSLNQSKNGEATDEEGNPGRKNLGGEYREL